MGDLASLFGSVEQPQLPLHKNDQVDSGLPTIISEVMNEYSNKQMLSCKPNQCLEGKSLKGQGSSETMTAKLTERKGKM